MTRVIGFSVNRGDKLKMNDLAEPEQKQGIEGKRVKQFELALES
ncbi:hypothetical protein PAAG_04207 [Paracoccidioides lutzii Pb01]|uniref:Uncharacterized protein n=1 Tax=Paracoccidioides lutzii (strain ATCC MYA-826 / Pb01) TaxID=502779 RepID=C1H0B3_PARBA|nr:hypothetical protein PAAG_04207 [Paracoccidioides lutzii Pb01]EEH33154.2 hypothetical protein PAAG_04207 [Paracoccidioides lutzii Pb01]